jgi:eukaryotic-like serine/threonine-protein kinase
LVNRERESRSEAKDALIGSVVGGRYRIEALLGEGGMGVVYRAEQLDLKKKVAVKLLHRDMVLNAEVVARFEREAVAGGRIAHPHVASAFDFGRLDDGVYFLALEFVEGKSLGRLMEQQAPLSERMALRIAGQIADALAAAHAAGVVHRDLKPENVMLLDRLPGDEFVKVLDFGIAKLRSTGGEKEQALTQLGTVFGTPEYMSPEQARGMEVDGRSDLYTLGLMLYEMLGGASPFRHEDVVVILARQLSMQPPPLSDRVSRPTRELVTKLLQKEREDRPKSAIELRDAISGLLERADIPRDSTPELEIVSDDPELETTAELRKGRASVGAAEDAATLMAMPKPARAASSGSGVLAAPANSGLAAMERDRRTSHVPLFGYAFPKRFLYAFAGLIALSAALTALLWRSTGGESSSSPPRVSAEDGRRAELLALAQKAQAGDRLALATLSVVPAAERSPETWRALVHGHFVNGEGDRSLGFLQGAVQAVPALNEEPQLGSDLRALALSDAHGEQALELAATWFGQRGADLIYELSNDKTLGKPALTQRARELLREDRVRKQMSAPLSAAVRLSTALKTPRCNELKSLLAELAGAFDQRAVSGLNRLTERRGCGLLGLGDCYSCLRGGRELKTALDAAKARPAPKFETPAPIPSAAASSSAQRSGPRPANSK